VGFECVFTDMERRRLRNDFVVRRGSGNSRRKCVGEIIAQVLGRGPQPYFGPFASRFEGYWRYETNIKSLSFRSYGIEGFN